VRSLVRGSKEPSGTAFGGNWVQLFSIGFGLAWFGLFLFYSFGSTGGTLPSLLSIAIIGVGAVIAMAGASIFLRGRNSSKSDDAMRVGSTSTKPRGLAAIKDKLEEPNLDSDLAAHLNAIGMSARPLEKGDPELIHSGGGVVGDPVLASVKVEARNFQVVEVWRVMGSGPGDWFRYFFVYAVKGKINNIAPEFEADLAWNASKEGAISDIYWHGGGLAARLNSDKELGDMLLNLGLPHARIGKPMIIGGGGRRGNASYVVESNERLGYIGIQLLPRGTHLSYQGNQLFDQVSTTKQFPTVQQLEAADRIAKHVRDYLDLAGI